MIGTLSLAIGAHAALYKRAVDATKIAAVAIMGKPAYDLFKRTVLKSLRVRASS